MAITCVPYMIGIDGITNGYVNFNWAAFRVSLHTATYVPNRITHGTRADLTGEVSGSPYVSPGLDVTVTVALDETVGGTRVTISDATWAAAGFTDVRYAVLYQNNGGLPEDDILVFYVDFGEDLNPAGTDFVLDWAATGALFVRPELP